MYKTDLIQKVIWKCMEGDFSSKAAAKRAVEAVFDVISDSIADGETVSISDFGTFRAAARSARTGRNPVTGEIIEIDAKRVPAFKAASKLKKKVAGDRSSDNSGIVRQRE